jgi:rhodanese-related sulfurtransferase
MKVASPSAQPRSTGARCARFAFGLVLVALVPALFSAWLHPHRPSWHREGEVGAAMVSHWSDALWVDARSAEVYAQRHVPGALNLSAGSWESEIGAVLGVWSPGRRIVVYCDGHGCQASHEVAQRLRAELGLTDVYVLTGGWNAWLREAAQ